MSVSFFVQDLKAFPKAAAKCYRQRVAVAKAERPGLTRVREASEQ